MKGREIAGRATHDFCKQLPFLPQTWHPWEGTWKISFLLKGPLGGHVKVLLASGSCSFGTWGTDGKVRADVRARLLDLLDEAGLQASFNATLECFLCMFLPRGASASAERSQAEVYGQRVHAQANIQAGDVPSFLPRVLVQLCLGLLPWTCRGCCSLSFPHITWIAA